MIGQALRSLLRSNFASVDRLFIEEDDISRMKRQIRDVLEVSKRSTIAALGVDNQVAVLPNESFCRLKIGQSLYPASTSDSENSSGRSEEETTYWGGFCRLGFAELNSRQRWQSD
jgi:hypothetical protein